MDDELLAIAAAFHVLSAQRHARAAALSNARSPAVSRWKLSGRDYERAEPGHEQRSRALLNRPPPHSP